jgi:DNA-binding transcriptional ArsR family regulator
MNMNDVLSIRFGAMAHPVRRSILETLASGSAKVGELTAMFVLTPPAITNHLKVLERAGLIRRRAEAQTRIISLCTDEMAATEDWLKDVREFWEDSFDKLDAHLQSTGITQEEET